MVETIRERLAGMVEFIPADSEDAQMVLIVSGCSSACTRVEDIRDRPVHYVTSPEDAERWIAGIL